MKPQPSRLVTARIPAAIVDEIQRIAKREAESQSTIIRRLLRLGLATRQTEAGRG